MSVGIWDLMTDSTARPRKSDRTRAAILAAARTLFATNGFERTTVREIAERAAIDPAMLIRYFGSKDELFAQAAVFDLAIPDLGSIDPAVIGETLVRHFLTLWEGENVNHGLPVLLRSAASNDYAAEKLREVFGAQVMLAIARVGSPETAAERAGLIASQLLGFALTRYILKLPPVVAMTTLTIVRKLGKAIQLHATGT